MVSTVNRTIIVLGEELSCFPTSVLEKAGIHCFFARDPYEAILHLRRAEPSCLLFEASKEFPRMENFLSLAKEVCPTLKIMTFFPGAGREPQSHLNRLDVDDFLVYPFSVEELSEKTRQRVSDPPRPKKKGGDHLEKRIEFLEALNGFRHRLALLLADVKSLGTEIVNFASKTLRAERVTLFYQENEQGKFSLLASKGISQDWVKSYPAQPLQGPSATVASSGKTLLRKRSKDGPCGRGGPYESESYLIVPLLDEQRVAGILNVTHKQKGLFSEADSENLVTIADASVLHLKEAFDRRSLEVQSFVDPLTGLYNRRYFDRCLKVESVRAQRYHRHLSLALFDIDDFKKYNDEKGHLTGDRVLKEVAKILQTNFRKVDILTRWGGEEFAVILPETTIAPDSVETQAVPDQPFLDRVRLAVERHPYEEDLLIKGKSLTLSGGVATFPTDTRAVDELFEAAQEALKKAKNSGKNRIVLAGELSP